MSVDIVLPRLGESIEEGTVVRWLKAVGDPVEEDEPVVEISTDKVDSEVPAPAAGWLAAIVVIAGETVAVGSVVGRIEPGPDPAPASNEVQGGRSVVAVPDDGPGAPPARPSPPGGARERPPPAGARLSPAVRWMAETLSVDPGSIAGSGAGGRVTRRDVERVVRDRDSTSPDPVGLPAPAAPALPAAGRLPVPVPGDPVPDSGDDRHRLLPPIRQVIGANLRRSIQEAAHAFVSTAVDYQRVDDARRGRPERAEEKLTFLPFVSFAAVRSLAAFPLLNARRGGPDTIEVVPVVNLGVAVDLDHSGLRVPVVRNASELRLRPLARRMGALAEGVAAGTLVPADYAEGSFTVSNVGTFGTTLSVPIINYPQVAILCVDGIRPTPVAVAGERGELAIAVHPVGSLSLSFDHRVFDGAYAAAYLASVRDQLEHHDWGHEI